MGTKTSCLSEIIFSPNFTSIRDSQKLPLKPHLHWTRRRGCPLKCLDKTYFNWYIQKKKRMWTDCLNGNSSNWPSIRQNERFEILSSTCLCVSAIVRIVPLLCLWEYSRYKLSVLFSQSWKGNPEYGFTKGTFLLLCTIICVHVFGRYRHLLNKKDANFPQRWPTCVTQKKREATEAFQSHLIW